MRHKIKLPINITETRYGVEFVRGVGYAEDKRIVELMRKKKFEVTPEPKKVGDDKDE